MLDLTLRKDLAQLSIQVQTLSIRIDPESDGGLHFEVTEHNVIPPQGFRQRLIRAYDGSRLNL